MPPVALTPTSYIVLGLVDLAGPASPYELKARVAASVGNFWTVQHSRLYAEPERLAEAGLLAVEQEEGGRRRKRYTLTDLGRDALRAWVADPEPAAPVELRNPALLRIFFGADPAAVARDQLPVHEQRLAGYEALAAAAEHAPADAPRGPRITLEAGIRHEREWLAFWSELAGPEPGAPQRDSRPGRAGR